jgi:hypothetical protein
VLRHWRVFLYNFTSAQIKIRTAAGRMCCEYIADLPASVALTW